MIFKKDEQRENSFRVCGFVISCEYVMLMIFSIPHTGMNSYLDLILKNEFIFKVSDPDSKSQQKMNFTNFPGIFYSRRNMRTVAVTNT